MKYLIALVFSFPLSALDLGVEVLFQEGHDKKLEGKKVGLITNHTGINQNFETTVTLFASSPRIKLAVLFSPEHGLDGSKKAGEFVIDSHKKHIPVYSLHGDTRRPTEAMLDNLDVLIFDIQDIGSRSYTYISTLFYTMEEAAKQKIPLWVLDRPNPLGGLIIDGPGLTSALRSFVGYIDIPYCHGMTIGELAQYFNHEYNIHCDLTVIPMKGWQRSMNFMATGLPWIPTSPNIPEPDTPLFYPATGILGELELVNIGIGYTMPFKVVAAPWINADSFAEKLNAQKLPGVHFTPIHFEPFYGSFKNTLCHGVKIHITNYSTYRPASVQLLLIGMLRSIYPKEFLAALKKTTESKRKMFSKVIGNSLFLEWLENERFVTWKMLEHQKPCIEAFKEKRQKYLLYQ